MNKTYMIVGGASVASLAVGAAGGYLIAKKRFDNTVDGLIALEVNKTKKYFSVLLMEAKAAKPDSPTDILVDEDEPVEDEELTEADLKVIEKGRKTLSEANQALTNYQGYATKPDLKDVVTSNIFSNGAQKKPLPPRDPTGKFAPKQPTVADTEDTPYLITHEEFLLNDMDHDQENLKYFIRDETLIMVVDNESVDIDRVGEVNLTLFPDVPEGEPSIICVRNEGLQIDYEIQLTHESLTEHMGLGEDDDYEELDGSDAAEYTLQE